MLSFVMHQEFPPPETLQDVIKCFWYDSLDNREQSGFKVVPDGYVEIIFHFASDLSVLNQGTLYSLPSPFMIGLLNQPVVFHWHDRLEIIGIRCFPWTVFDLLGLPPGKGTMHAFEHPIATLQPALSEHIRAGRIEEAITYVTRYFVGVRSQVHHDSMLFKAGVAMRRAKGALSVSEVAAAAHATVRTLERNFKQSSGHTVKDVSTLMRFEQLRNRLWLEPNTNLAGLAHELGYSDQSHLSKEFKRYSGTTPAAFARESKKRKQIFARGEFGVTNDFVAFIQS